MKIGIYKITCVNNNKIYIGQTTNFEARKRSHLYELKGKRHFNRILQNCYNKYGAASLTFEFILECKSDELTIFEQITLDKYRNQSSKNIMNLAKCVNSFFLGKKHSNETKKLMSQQRQGLKNSFYGRKHTKESKKKQSKAKLGKVATQATRLKLSKIHSGENNSFYGKHHTLEAKAKMRAAHICKPVTLISPEGILTYFASMHEASKITGIARSNLHRLIKGIYKQSKGWRTK